MIKPKLSCDDVYFSWKRPYSQGHVYTPTHCEIVGSAPPTTPRSTICDKASKSILPPTVTLFIQLRLSSIVDERVWTTPLFSKKKNSSISPPSSIPPLETLKKKDQSYTHILLKGNPRKRKPMPTNHTHTFYLRGIPVAEFCLQQLRFAQNHNHVQRTVQNREQDVYYPREIKKKTMTSEESQRSINTVCS